MEEHEDYERFAYSGWQEAFNINGLPKGFHLYTCKTCGTTIAEISIPGHSIEMCDSILNAIGRSDLENLVK